MLLGEIIKRTGLSKDTIRFYEKQGLIVIGKKERRDNNYKEYSEENLERILTIKRLKGFGFTLNEISEILLLIEANKATCDNVSDKIQEKIELIDAKMNELVNLKTLMLNKLKSCQTCCPTIQDDINCKIIIADIPT